MEANSVTIRRLVAIHRELQACSACPKMIGPVVHGPAIDSRVLLIGQAPGPREASFGRPFAWTAGKTLFRWFEATGMNEETFRASIYMAAVARCFPGKAKSGGDRVPDKDEIAQCRTFLSRETRALAPDLVIPVGMCAIHAVLGERAALVDVVGTKLRRDVYGVTADVIALPHPSGVSTWHKLEPGKTLLAQALRLIAKHPAMRAPLRAR